MIVCLDMNESGEFRKKFRSSETELNAASAYLAERPDFLNRIMTAESAMEVRKVVLESFGMPTDKDNDLSSVQAALLSEAISRWNKNQGQSSE